MTKFKIPSPDLQIDFSVALDQIRQIYLQDALSKIIETIDLSVLDRQLAKYVPQSSLKALATRGLRGEILFPVPCILEANPFILGYIVYFSDLAKRNSILQNLAYQNLNQWK